MTIERSNQVWAMDITYIPMARGFVYLAAVVDWASRRVLAHRVAISMDTEFCREALEEALSRYGCPEIFNTDQGSQFTSAEFTDVLHLHGIRISMDGRGAWRDNVFVERLWRTVKYEEVYLKAYDSVSAARAGLSCYLAFYNARRPHSSLGGRRPMSSTSPRCRRPGRQPERCVRVAHRVGRAFVAGDARPPPWTTLPHRVVNRRESTYPSPGRCLNGWGHLLRSALAN